ncbi:hypothetical protein MA16_Dca022513 [Dendrobium catenatum]|uniref:Retrotransposon gag domain-containing protein n=1 Tax=Dendrobium catenatum TaxID=906689 RepID=A0A2I0VTF9_9ASPA|nr:hypothetical protein MA16_Dca022513 [Dendrobium catenatum]
MRPLLFKGIEGPIEAENWLLRIEKILEGMNCPEERKVSLATFALEGEAERWWKGLISRQIWRNPKYASQVG